MKVATISETKNSLTALLDRVGHGETVLVTDRGRPVARLEPVAHPDETGHDAGRLARLERAGIIHRARKGPFDQIESEAPPAPTSGGDIVAALVDERRSGR